MRARWRRGSRPPAGRRSAWPAEPRRASTTCCAPTSAAGSTRRAPPGSTRWPPVPRGQRIGPVVVARQARVALGDEIGEGLGASLVVVLIGERPGLSSPDSLGLYLTHAPRVGRVDAERNCISNVRPEGLAPAQAA